MTRYVLWDKKGIQLGVLFTDDPDFLESVVHYTDVIDNASEAQTPNDVYCIYCGGLRK